MKKILFILVYTLLFGLLSKFIYSEYSEIKEHNANKPNAFEVAAKNYKNEVEILAKKFKLPPSYLMAVIMLESSGKKDVPVRYEKSIYKKLLQLKKGKIDSFENLKQKDVAKLTRKQLKLLSCSYGPFQIMGYKSFILNIPLDTLRGEKNLFYAVKWINLTYGDSLRNKNYKDAFHIHNAGKKYPKNGKPSTHDPLYVENGLKYEELFRKLWTGKKD
jgi:hypothetical protein